MPNNKPPLFNLTRPDAATIHYALQAYIRELCDHREPRGNFGAASAAALAEAVELQERLTAYCTVNGWLTTPPEPKTELAPKRARNVIPLR